MGRPTFNRNAFETLDGQVMAAQVFQAGLDQLLAVCRAARFVASLAAVVSAIQLQNAPFLAIGPRRSFPTGYLDVVTALGNRLFYNDSEMNI